eukprot:4108065-Pyramimonas_sp.AAC.1
MRKSDHQHVRPSPPAPARVHRRLSTLLYHSAHGISNIPSNITRIFPADRLPLAGRQSTPRLGTGALRQWQHCSSTVAVLTVAVEEGDPGGGGLQGARHRAGQLGGPASRGLCSTVPVLYSVVEGAPHGVSA